MTLTAKQIEQRDGRLTASRVACLMTGDEAKIMNLWREMVGDPEFVPEDLSGVWAVQLGSVTESLNLDWYERKTKRKLSKRGDVIQMRTADWAACTLDGWDEENGCAIECKHVGGREPLAKVIERYQPQLHWQMLVTNSRAVMLSVIEGTSEPVVEEIPFDADYAAELWRRAVQFMTCVRSLTPPVALAPVAAPVKAEKTYDMSQSNEWGHHALDWLENYPSKKKADIAEKALKSLVASDAVRCFGAGVEIRRDRAGRLTTKDMR